MSPNRLSILNRAKPEDIRLEPYPYLVIENALPDELYQELARTYPKQEKFFRGREIKDTWYDFPACIVTRDQEITPLWREFFAYHSSQEFWNQFVDLLGDRVRNLHPDLETRLGKDLRNLKAKMRELGAAGNQENYGSDVAMECQFYLNLTRKPRAARGPHLDRPTELFAALLYFRTPEDESTGGDLQICRARDPGQRFTAEPGARFDTLPMEIDETTVEIVETVKYAPNTLVLFLNSHLSIHAVTTRSATPVPRLHINFCADLFNLGENALFTKHYPLLLNLKRKLEHAPIIWRLAKLLPG